MLAILDMFLHTKVKWYDIKGGYLGKSGQNYKFFVFCSKSVLRYGGITSQILTPSKIGGKGGQELV